MRDMCFVSMALRIMLGWLEVLHVYPSDGYIYFTADNLACLFKCWKYRLHSKHSLFMPQAFQSKPSLKQHHHLHHLSPDRQTPKRAITLHKKLPVEAASPPNTTNTHCHSIPQHISNTTLHYTSPHTTARRRSHPRRLFSLSLTAGHSFTFLANPESPGLLAVAEQSATHHGLFVHAKEAKACALCISIPALARPACRL